MDFQPWEDRTQDPNRPSEKDFVDSDAAVHPRPPRSERIRPRFLFVWRLKRSRLRSDFHATIARDVRPFLKGWILDIGCGPGLLLNRLAADDEPVHLAGIDIDRRMLLSVRNMRPTELIRATAVRLPIRDRSVSVVLSSASLKDWNDRKEGVREIARILEPGGNAFLYDFITNGEGSNPRAFAERYGKFTNLMRRAMRFFAPFSLHEAREIAQSLEVCRLLSRFNQNSASYGFRFKDRLRIHLATRAMTV